MKLAKHLTVLSLGATLSYCSSGLNTDSEVAELKRKMVLELAPNDPVAALNHQRYSLKSLSALKDALIDKRNVLDGNDLESYQYLLNIGIPANVIADIPPLYAPQMAYGFRSGRWPMSFVDRVADERKINKYPQTVTEEQEYYRHGREWMRRELEQRLVKKEHRPRKSAEYSDEPDQAYQVQDPHQLTLLLMYIDFFESENGKSALRTVFDNKDSEQGGMFFYEPSGLEFVYMPNDSDEWGEDSAGTYILPRIHEIVPSLGFIHTHLKEGFSGPSGIADPYSGESWREMMPEQHDLGVMRRTRDRHVHNVNIVATALEDGRFNVDAYMREMIFEDKSLDQYLISQKAIVIDLGVYSDGRQKAAKQ